MKPPNNSVLRAEASALLWKMIARHLFQGAANPHTSTGVVMVGPLLRSVRVFKHFAWLEVGSVKVALFRPT